MTGPSKCFLLLIRRSVHNESSAGKAGRFLKIRDARVPIRDAKSAELVPRGYVDVNLINKDVRNLKWLMQKDALRQDVFLIGVPGLLRSSLALAYCELTNREVEYLTLTRDTTEADIKQRREIRSNNAFYTDLCAVRAALNGRVLIIDGVERAERNVLPILNNLLENREVQLEDGRFLMAPNKYDKLLEKYSREELKRLKFERVSEDFYVIALGLPVPTFKGHSLDPPLRSRFQCLNLGNIPFNVAKELCEGAAPTVDKSKLEKVLGFAYGINAQQGKDGLGLPRLSIENLIKAMSVWNVNPSLTEAQILALVYPEKSILRNDSEQSVLDQFYKEFQVQRPTSSVTAKIAQIERQPTGDATVKLDYNGHPVEFTTKCGTTTKHPYDFIATETHENFLAELSALHAVGDFCVLGEKGSGKSTVIKEFAKRFGYAVETIAVYNDLNSRDLLQSRRILENGDTVWEDGQLIRAAKNGDLCILDGIEQAHWSTIEVLAPLIHHRFLPLPDGTRLVSPIAFSILRTQQSCTAEELNKRGVFEISPRFRLVALANSESSNATGPTAKWLNDQVLSMFLFHTLPTMQPTEELQLITKLIPNVDKNLARKLIGFVQKLHESRDQKIRNVALSLSLRRIIGILRRHSLNPDEGIYEAVQRAALARFLPAVTRTAFEKRLQDSGIVPTRGSDSSNIEDLMKQLVNVSKEEFSSLKNESLVPDILFYDNKQHSKIMSDMIKDFTMGSHILLIGNQGTGKNKITDRFLQLIRRPRQYIQLHRDTTIQSLTIQSTITDGVLRYEDSPLIKAVRDGHVLVIDEADKAPLHVIAILKSLLDSGILYLADGRRIQPKDMDPLPGGKSIAVHPEFRIIMLANRPGFPFLGNDLFGVLGDLLSVHVVDNPDRESEIAMLKKYGPSVSDATLNKLVSVFEEFRQLSNDGLISYPYSTRELVAIVKHLESFPNDPIELAVRNVFDFDTYSREAMQTIDSVFKKYDIPIDNAYYYAPAPGERLEIEGGEQDFDLSKLDSPKYGKVDPNNAPHMGGNTWAGGTGGYNTAGLGGVGGPFRLDAGHDVKQISELAKQQVPAEIRRKARAIAKKEYEKRLKEIDMSPHDAETYQQLYDKIAKQTTILKNVIDSLDAREKERQWAKHQTSGDLDDAKIIEGMTGERAIYRKRVELQPEPGTVQQKPKYLTLLVDVSGSMYRFNGYDKRLQKSIEATLLVMEALHGKSEKIKYNIVGHSGETFEVNFAGTDKPPENEKERLVVLKKMLAHSQFCLSGDYTLEAIECATRKLAKEENADERFVIALSDANLDRYGIQPKHLAQVMDLERNVNTYLILLGSLGPQAERLRQNLPAGRAFICQNTVELPHIIQEIFASTLTQ